MEIMKFDYEMRNFSGEDVELLLSKLGFNLDGYFIAMTKPSLLSMTLVGNLSNFSNRYCIVCFSDTELNLIMLSRMNSKKVTEIVKIPRTEIINMKLSNILISYTLKMKINDSKMKFQVFKKVGKFEKIKTSLESFKNMYNL